MNYINPIVAEVSPNIYAAAKTAGLNRNQATQVEQMSYTIKEHRKLVKLAPDVARSKYDKLDGGIQQQLKFMYKDAEYLKEPESVGDEVFGAIKQTAKLSISPLILAFKAAGQYNKIINEPYKVARLAAQGDNPFAYKTWKKAWDGNSVYDEGALKAATDYFGRYDVEVAKGLLAGKTPGQIIIDYGKTDATITDAISQAFNNPKEWEWWFKLTGYTGDYSFIYFE